MKKGIIFDMDGTLWDSSENVAKSWDKVVQERAGGLRRITAKDVQNVMGHTIAEIAGLLFPSLDPKAAANLVDLCGEEEIAYLRRRGGALYPHLEETLGILSERYPLAIVSNCQKGYIEAFLDYYQFGNYFCDTECFGNTLMAKGENIGLLMRRNQFDKAIYVGDIQGDYDASKKAGAMFIHAAYGFGTIDEDVARIHGLQELPFVAQKVFGDA